ncbi:MAG: DUF6483 family protein [Eubacteriales bacterium]
MTMYENDYILRMLRQVSEVFAKLLLNKKIKNYEVCHAITDDTLKNTFGISRELLLKLPTSSIVDLVCGYNNVQAEILLSLTQLLIREGEIYEEEEIKQDAMVIYRKSLELLDALHVEEDESLEKYIITIKNNLLQKMAFHS